MTPAPDPQAIRLAREQARQIILSHATDVEYMSIGEHLADFDEFSSLPEDEFARVQGRVDKQIRHAVVTVSWPNEQPQDGAADEAAVRELPEPETAAEWLQKIHALRAEYGPREFDFDDDDVAALLAERERQAERIRELEAERAADVPAVAEVMAASGGTWMATEGAIRNLGARFADRIAALDARDADGSAS